MDPVLAVKFDFTDRRNGSSPQNNAKIGFKLVRRVHIIVSGGATGDMLLSSVYPSVGFGHNQSLRAFHSTTERNERTENEKWHEKCKSIKCFLNKENVFLRKEKLVKFQRRLRLLFKYKYAIVLHQGAMEPRSHGSVCVCVCASDSFCFVSIHIFFFLPFYCRQLLCWYLRHVFNYAERLVCVCDRNIASCRVVVAIHTHPRAQCSILALSLHYVNSFHLLSASCTRYFQVQK